MVTYRHDELDNATPPPAGYSFVKEVAKQARNAVCSLYSSYPGAFTLGAIPGTPAETWTHAFMNDVCNNSPTPTPPPENPPFEGGQCPVMYIVSGTQDIYREGDPTVVYETTWQQAVMGKIQGSGIDAEGELGAGWIRYMVQGDGSKQLLGLGLNPPISGEVGFAITSIVRQDGLPDECGNPPNGYIPIPLPALDDPIWRPPFVPLPPGAGNGWDIKIPFGWIDADFNLNVDVGGVTVNIDFGGITVDLGNRDGDGSPGSFDGSRPDLDGLRDAIDGARDAAEGARDSADGAKDAIRDYASNDPSSPFNDPDKQNRDEKSEDDPKDEDGIDRLLAVEVQLTQMPANKKSQAGAGAPDVVYAGWFEFKKGDHCFPRQPIHFGLNRYNAPQGATGYGYTVYMGFEAKATVITAKPDT